LTDASTYCFIINCASNTFASEGLFRKHENKIRNELPEAVFKYIQPEDSIQDYVNSNLHRFTHFVACGGDGTVNQVANSLAGKMNRVMGVIPLGSGNDFAKNIGLKCDFEHDFSILLKGKIKNIDAIQANHEFFINTYGIGVDGLTNYYASRSIFKSGFYKYFFGGLRALINAIRFDIGLRIDNKEQMIFNSIWMIAVANGKTEGGRYRISPTSDNGDGKAEIVIVKGIPRLSLILEFIKLSLGIPFKEEIIEIFDLREDLSINCSEYVRAHSDGEQMGKQKQYGFEIKQGALRVIVK
jgi:YegS/Rv2252/BmrU family lipid kinase